MAVRDDFCERIERLRGWAGLTARGVDTLAGLTQKYTRALETGKTSRERVSAHGLSRLASLFGASVEWILNGEGDPPTERSVRRAVNRAKERQAATRSRGKAA